MVELDEKNAESKTLLDESIYNDKIFHVYIQEFDKKENTHP